MEDLENKILALESENKTLKDIIEKVDAQLKALDQTLTEVLRANIQLKAGCTLLENKIDKLNKEAAKNIEVPPEPSLLAE